jgi:hypothetical protein
MMGTAHRIELRWVPRCPNVDRVRQGLYDVLAELEIGIDVEERVGDYASPTVVVDGLDVVTGMLPRPGAACRLDLPTHAQLIDALRPPGPR